MANNVNKTVVFFIVLAVLVLIFFMVGPFYTLSEMDIAVLTRFGQPVRKPVSEAGLHFKIPFVDKPNVLSKRILEWDGEVKQFPTYDKRMILVDSTVRWKIDDPLLFFESLTNVDRAMSKLDDILDAASREVVSRHSFEELVRNSIRITNLDARTTELLLSQGFTQDELDAFPDIEVGRNSLMGEMKNYAQERMDEYGIEIVDYFVKKIFYIQDNLQSVFQSMSAERNKIAQAYISEGEKLRQEILGNTEQRTKEIMADAQERSKEIRGEADSEAASIYNGAYNRSASTRDFYEFIKKMEMYEQMPSNTSLIITTDSEFFDMFKRF